MASTTTRRKGGAPRSMELYTQMEQVVAEASPVNAVTGKPLTVANVQVPVATVKRHKFGTGPFDEHWLNLDCCGLLCATLTYGLHVFAVYAVCLVLLPPWMSQTNELGVRSFTLVGHFHRLCFTTIAVLAIAAHFKAMTTDPGAVPPDAIPLEEANTNGSNNPLESEEATESESPIPRKGKRLCRRCKTFKPKRAHHCSVCRRCIIKMDRKFSYGTFGRASDMVVTIKELTFLLSSLLMIFQITVLGSIIVWESEITNSFSYSSFTPSFPACIPLDWS